MVGTTAAAAFTVAGAIVSVLVTTAINVARNIQMPRDIQLLPADDITSIKKR